MGANGKQDQLRLGFLTAVEVPDKGFVGGLLVTNFYGRPLEFQCTVPVKPNPTQEILYGPTLGPFVLGELIGGTLLDKAGVKPHLIFTDCEPILELRNHVPTPVAMIEGSSSAAAPGSNPGAASESVTAGAAESVNPGGEPARTMKLGRQRIRFHAAHAGDEALVNEESRHIPRDADLCEPFDRVREALQEALRTGALR